MGQFTRTLHTSHLNTDSNQQIVLSWPGRCPSSTPGIIPYSSSAQDTGLTQRMPKIFYKLDFITIKINPAMFKQS